MTELELIKKDSYLSEFIEENKLDDKFISEHINAFLMVLESRNKCLNCKGLYTCSQLSKGERLSLTYNEVLLSEIEYCDYLLKKNKEDKLVKSFVYSDIPENFNNIDINTIDLLDNNQKQLCGLLLAILAKKENKGLYICGDLGVGKTYECISLANSLVKKNNKVAFLKVANFVNEMRKLVANDSSSYNELIDKIKKADYVFFDDIGAESVSTFSRDDLLFEILDYRMENKLCTIFTSNLNKQDLLKHYTFDRNDNSNLMKAKRLMERIDILTNDFVLTGDNKRRISRD